MIFHLFCSGWYQHDYAGMYLISFRLCLTVEHPQGRAPSARERISSSPGRRMMGAILPHIGADVVAEEILVGHARGVHDSVHVEVQHGGHRADVLGQLVHQRPVGRREPSSPATTPAQISRKSVVPT